MYLPRNRNLIPSQNRNPGQLYKKNLNFSIFSKKKKKIINQFTKKIYTVLKLKFWHTPRRQV